MTPNRSRFWILTALVPLAALLAPTAWAGVDQCSVFSAAAGPMPSTAPVFVTQTNVWNDGSCGGTGIVGLNPPCPNAVTVLPGEWCGPALFPFQVVTCWWLGTPNVVNLVVGFDVDGNGHIFDNTADPDVVRSALGPGVPFQATAPGAFSRLIVYPESAVPGGFAGDLTLVRCQ